MDRVAVFVDAGYLFAEGSRELCGEKLVRSRITLNHEAAIDALRAFAERISRLPLLRIYWYDGTSQGPSSQHITLAGMGFTKVRLGFVNSMGQQKGVDSLIVTDMIGTKPSDGRSGDDYELAFSLKSTELESIFLASGLRVQANHSSFDKGSLRMSGLPRILRASCRVCDTPGSENNGQAAPVPGSP